MSKVYTDNIEKRTGGTAMAVPATGKWPQANIADDAVGTAQLAATGTASATTFLRGDNSWAAVDTTGIQANQDDIALLAFRVAANGSFARYNLVDQSIDAFEDASGVDASASTNETRDSSGKYYSGGTAPTISGNWNSTGVDGSYTWYKWSTVTSSGSYTTDSAADYEYLVVAGGGGAGGNIGGGGGAGGYRTATGFPVAATTIGSITVGAGGAGGINEGAGASGSDSVFSTITSAGGGSGASRTGGGQAGGATGGSGGGGGASVSTPVTGFAGNTPSTSPAQGYAGGDGISGGGSTSTAGGGGGASAVGTDGTNNGPGGAGGAGTSSSIDGSATARGGGGGGGAWSGLPGGAGGSGGGGNGAGPNGNAGSNNTGGGGGGANNGGTGGAGGSGIVIIKRLTGSTSPANMTLVSNAQTAQSAPTTGDLVITYTDGAGTAVANTNIKAYISRDGSAYTSAVTLASQGTTGGHTILTANGVDLSGITSGTSMRWKIETLVQSASMDTRIQAVSLGWS